ncbi:L,D-transpeptidase family protein [Geomonas sp.]|uniref:L,D-transpeptidase family protein n=1 Tax=Geomonas sp. TaxID=2651584 RepID=UPI002B45EEFA|nr:L,D-transpeptidase family protein [Geomonas sp.]HJV34027.1 L,D-transpeptidase family protein [Geomonas sp.]
MKTPFIKPLFILSLLGTLLVAERPATAARVLFHDEVAGVASVATVGEDDSLIEMAREYDLGYDELVAANPGVDPIIPRPGTLVVIPSSWILPEVPKKEGIVIDISGMRLYYFTPPKSSWVETFPVGIGREGWDTPLGTYSIIEKIVGPAWYVPASIRAEKPELPEIVPPGPENPMGSHALRLSNRVVLIHGTDRPYGIGRRVSHGCIHLYPEDIVTLFWTVKMKTPVTIVRQPVKATLFEGRVLVEVYEDGEVDLEQEATAVLKRKGLWEAVDQEKLKGALAAHTGIPVDVTGTAPPKTDEGAGEGAPAENGGVLEELGK